MGNFTYILSSCLDDEIDRKTNKTKYKYQLNITAALAKVKETIALIFTKSNIIGLLNRLIQMFLSNLLPIRPDRSFERNRQKRKRYHKGYLPL